MTDFRCGQIWLVNFDPSFGHEYRKVRPALIVQSDAFIASGTLLVVIPLSSRVAKRTSRDVLVRKDASNRLMRDSLLKSRQISSFDKRRFIKLIGTLDERTLTAVEAVVKPFLFQKADSAAT